MKKLHCTLLVLLAPVIVFGQATLTRSVSHTQPMTGLVFWPDNAEDHHTDLGQSISLEFQYCLPCKVVTSKQNGQILYNWTWLDNILNDIAGRGHQAVIRFRYEYPSGEKINGTKGATAVPDYIKALPDYNETYAKNPGGDGPTYYADWSNHELLWFTKQFYTDLQARYGNDPRIAFLEVGFGHWSEYHIYGTKIQFGVNFPTKQYQSEFFQHLDTTMTIPWLVSIDAGDSQYSPMQSDAAMRACTFGLFDDSFMHSEHDFSQGDGWNEQCWQWSDPTGTRWHTGVNGGEISYYTDNDQQNFLNPAGMYGVTWEQAAAKYHITFINANDCTEGRYATPQRVTQAGLSTGYHFVVTSVTTSPSTSDSTSPLPEEGLGEVTVTNTGVAPIYRDAYLAVCTPIDTTRATESLRGLLPGQSHTYTIPTALTDADNLHIVSNYILPGQEIQFDANCTITTTTDICSPLPIDKPGEVSKVILLPSGQLRIISPHATCTILGQPITYQQKP